MNELTRLEVDRGVATITMDSPENRNALSARLRNDLATHLHAAVDDCAVRVIVLTHTGPVFCAGADLQEARRVAVPEPDHVRFPAILEAVWTSPKPVVAKVAGPARAGGLGLLAACDIVVAAASATFAFTEVRIGVVPALISVTVVPRMLPHAAHELLLTGESFDAQTAARVGLVNSVVPAPRLDREVERYVDMLGLGAPSALAATKDLLRTQSAEEVRAGLTAMAAVSKRHFDSAEGREGLTAFSEKRRPTWVPN